VAAAVLAVAVATFVAIGGNGLAGVQAKPAKPKPAKTQDTGKGDDGAPGSAKVTICHKGKVTLRISVNAVSAHELRHHDTQGACATTGAAKAKAKDAEGQKGKAKDTGDD
jgi:hypothetical protein